MTADANHTPFGAHAPRGALARLMAATRACPDTWLGRRRAFLLRAVATRLLDGPVDCEAMGVRLRLHPLDNICEKRIAFTPQYFDAQERALLAARIRPDFVFVDIGANIGGYALAVAAMAGPAARILAIEPQHAVYERLVYNIRQNEFATVKALECAVSDMEGEATLFLDPRNRGQASLRIVNSEAATQQERVAARPLVRVLADEAFSRIDAMKIDVEGAEDLVLEAFLRDAPPALLPRLILLDAGSLREPLASSLAGAGYRQTARSRANIAFEKRNDT